MYVVQRVVRLAALALPVVAALAGCAAPRQPIPIAEPGSVAYRSPAALTRPDNGGIFQQAAYWPLFEDPKPRHVGDILTIAINEKLAASQTANSSADRTSELKAGVPVWSAALGKRLQGLDLQATTGNKFDGKGETVSGNLFAGNITVTVIEVLPNGNLLVAGEKQIGLRQNSETLRMSGVVNPKFVQPGNLISSTQVADVRLDYRGGGYIEEAQIMGWASRVFNSWFPF
jgi:flagellar L-ring protein precursor FlgH